MATRKAPFGGIGDSEHLSRKRRRVCEENESGDDPSPSLDSLNDGCLLNICSYSAANDLNSRLCAIRAHESLDQTREGTWESLFNAITNENWDEETKLKITRTERLQPIPNISEEEMIARYSQLTGVTSLQMTYNPNTGNRPLSSREVRHISILFPNLVSVDLSGLMSHRPPDTVCFTLPEDAHISRELHGMDVATIKVHSESGRT